MRRLEASRPYCTHRRARVWKVTGQPAPSRLTVFGWQWLVGAGAQPKLRSIGQARAATVASRAAACVDVRSIGAILVLALKAPQHVDFLKVISARLVSLPQHHLVVAVHVAWLSRAFEHAVSPFANAGLKYPPARLVARLVYGSLSATERGHLKVFSVKAALPHGIARADFFAADGFRRGLGHDVPPTVHRIFNLSQRGMP